MGIPSASQSVGYYCRSNSRTGYLCSLSPALNNEPLVLLTNITMFVLYSLLNNCRVYPGGRRYMPLVELFAYIGYALAQQIIYRKITAGYLTGSFWLLRSALCLQLWRLCMHLWFRINPSM
jgi:hypothetical protein